MGGCWSSYDGWETYDSTVGTLLHKDPQSHYVLRAVYRFVGEQIDVGVRPKPGISHNNGLMLHSQHPSDMLRDQRWPVSYEVQLRGDMLPAYELTTSNICSLGIRLINENGSGWGGSRHQWLLLPQLTNGWRR